MVPSVLFMLALLAADTPASCPGRMLAWRSSGEAVADGMWGAEVLDIRGEIAVLRELLIRFGPGELPPDQARWFEAPVALEPIAIRTRTLSFMGDELRYYCRHLAGPAMDSLRDQSKSRCLVSEGGSRMIVRGTLTVTDAEIQVSRGLMDGGLGVLVEGETIDPDKLECESVEELTAAFDQQPGAAVESGAVDAIHALLEEMSGADGAFESGLAAIPPARQVQRLLRDHDAERVPQNLPSDFYMTATTASGAYAEALALEKMLTTDTQDQEVALKLLGDFASASSTPLLQLKLQSAIAASDRRGVSMTLRALLTADAAIAIEEATALLTEPDFVKPALGIFALTDPALREELDSLDVDDHDSLAEAGQRLADHLATLTE